MPHMVKYSESIYDLLEAIINDCFKNEWINNKYFNQFVDIKEVPHGRDY